MSDFNLSISDRRSADRHPLRTEVWVQLADGRQGMAQSLDVGAGGMALVSDFNPPPGSALTARLRLPAKAMGGTVFEARATVANSVFCGAEAGFRVGLKFETLDDRHAATLKSFLG